MENMGFLIPKPDCCTLIYFHCREKERNALKNTPQNIFFSVLKKNFHTDLERLAVNVD